MATRSRIGLQLADGNILSVYHHWDGYPQWLGVTLNEKFNTREKVAELIDGGDISCCDSDSDWNLNKVENHVQYYNDRGDNTEPRLDSNFDDYVKNGEEYAYVFTLDHVWECYAIDRNYDDDYNVVGVNVKPATIPSEEVVA
jgi:hypothetical protein|tara:strand:- start:463 stop:888 length:426 start_codon:yes stop_codon:yes gene_type:complete